MKEAICKTFANEPEIRSEQWRRHAAGCRDCHELLKVADWMTEFAARTSPRSDLPQPSYLKFKARLKERLSAADRVVRPVNTMISAAGVLLVAVATLGVIIGGETRFGSVMIGAFSLLASYAWAVIAAALVGGVVYGVAAYFDGTEKRTK